MAQYAETTATARRRRRPPPAAVALAAVGALGAAAVLTGVVELPDFADALEGLTASLGAWTYLLVPALAFLETGAFVGLLVPGETAVLVGGVVAERGGVALVPLIGLIWLGAFGGEAVSFLIGRRLGRPFLERHGRRLGLGEAQLLRVERFFSRFGGRAVLFARFVGVLRALTPFVAGASSYPLQRVVPFSVAGTFVWATTFSLIGFSVLRNVRRHRQHGHPRAGRSRSYRRRGLSGGRTARSPRPAGGSPDRPGRVTPLRVAVLDDHPLVRAGVRAIVESAPDLRPVGDAASEEELWPLLRTARAHVLVLDLHHPGRDGLTLAARLSALDVTPRVVLHTALRSDELTVAAALAGVAVTVGKDESPPNLLRAIRAAGDPGARHERLDLVARGRVLAHLEPPDRPIAAMHLVDTPVSGIAEALRITPRDVRFRIEAMLRRLVPPAPASTQPM